MAYIAKKEDYWGILVLKKRLSKDAELSVVIAVSMILTLFAVISTVHIYRLAEDVGRNGNVLVLLLMNIASYAVCLAFLIYLLFRRRDERKMLRDYMHTYDVIAAGVIKRTFGDGAGKVISVSDGFLNLLKRSRDELFELYGGEYVNMVYAEDVERVKAEFYELYEKGEKIAVTYRLVSKTGKIKWVVDRGNVVTEDGVKFIYSVLVDITNLKEAELELYSANERFKIASKFMNHFIFNFDIKERKITCVSSPSVFGWSLPKVIENVPLFFHDKDVYPDAASECFDDVFYSIIDGASSASGKMPLLLTNGEMRNYKLTVINVPDENGEKTGQAVGIIEQLSDENEMIDAHNSKYRDFVIERARLYVDLDLTDGKVLYAKDIISREGKNVNLTGKKISFALEFVRGLLSEESRKVFDENFTSKKIELDEKNNDFSFEFMGYDHVVDAETWERCTVYKYDGKNGHKCALIICLDIAAQKQREIELIKLSETDPLTRIFNKSVFEERAGKMVDENEDGLLAYFTFDIDNFKQLNDTKGHEFGDTIIVSVVDEVNKFLEEGDLFGRIGGDEFAISMRVPSEEEAAQRANKIIRAAKSVCQVYGFNNAVSVGIAMFPKDAKDFRKLALFSDRAMYEAKRSGKAKYAFYVQSGD